MNEEVISLGSSLKGKRRVWNRIARDAFRGDPYYFPTIHMFSSKGLEQEFFVLSVDGKSVGRAKTAVDMNWISKRRENVGFIDDFVIHPDYKDYADKLIQRCLSVLKEKEEIDEVLVRYNLPAMQSDSFDQISVFPCSHTPPEYIDIFERNGFNILKRWVAYRAMIEGEFSVPEEEVKEGDEKIESLGWEIRRMNMLNKSELKQFNDLLYEAFIGHFGWNPAGMTGEEEKLPSTIKLFLYDIFMRLIRFEIWSAFDKEGKMLFFIVIHPEYNEVMNASMKGNKILRLPRLFINMRRTKMCTMDGLALTKDLRGFGFARTIFPWGINFGMNIRKYRGLDGIIITENIPSIKTFQPLINRYMKRFGVNLKIIEMEYVTMVHKFDSLGLS
jgi:hypothetical protein